MKRTSNDRFIFLRNGVFTFKKRIEGKRSPMQVSLETTDRALAREKRDEILKQLDAGTLEKIRGPRTNRAKVGAIIAVYRGVATLKNIQLKYVNQCVSNVYGYLRHAAGGDAATGDLNERDVRELFDAATFAKFRQHYFAGVLNDPERLKSRERGAASMMRHVHAVFSPDVRALYKHLALDWRTVDAWLKETSISAERRRHATLSGEAIREMDAAIEPFYEAWPDFWLVHALHKFTGLRNEEICNIRVEWFERAPWGQLFIVCKTRPYYEFKGSDGSVPVHSSVVARLARFVAGKLPTDHVLGTARPADWRTLVEFNAGSWDTSSLDAREELVDRIHARWMRRWTPPEKFAKRGYELRRWGAQLMELKYGKDASDGFLRHARSTVAERHYLEEWNRWRRLGSDLGITTTEGKGQTNMEVLGTWTTGAAAFLPKREDREWGMASGV